MARSSVVFSILFIFCIKLLSCEILDDSDDVVDEISENENETCGDTVLEFMTEAFENTTNEVCDKNFICKIHFI